MITAYDRTSQRGVTLNYRTLEMLMNAERAWAVHFGLTGAEFVLSQGSWSNAPASGDTHAGGGALDVASSSWDTAAQRDELVRYLRLAGFAAWYRPKLIKNSQTVWNPHIHAIAIGDREMSTAAAMQVAWYKQELNGLWPDGGGDDTGPRVTWSEYPQELQYLDMPGFEDKFPLRSDLQAVIPGDATELSMQRALGLGAAAYYQTRANAARLGAIGTVLSQLAAAVAAGEAADLTAEAIEEAANRGAARALDDLGTLHVIVDHPEPPPPA